MKSEIPIILIDDDYEKFSKTFIQTAKAYGFIVTWFSNLKEGFNCLKKDKAKKYKALILDAECYVNREDKHNTDAFLGKAITQLPNISKERYLPTVINTAYSKKVLTEPFKTLLKEQNISVFIKGKDGEALLDHLRDELANAPSFYIEQTYADVFTIFDKNYLAPDYKTSLITILLDGEKLDKRGACLAAMRKFLEVIFEKVANILERPEIFFNYGKVRYLKVAKALREKRNDNLESNHETKKQIYNFESYHETFVKNIHYTASNYGGSHAGELPSLLVIKSLTYGLLELLTWFQKAMDEAR